MVSGTYLISIVHLLTMSNLLVLGKEMYISFVADSIYLQQFCNIISRCLNQITKTLIQLLFQNRRSTFQNIYKCRYSMYKCSRQRELKTANTSLLSSLSCYQNYPATFILSQMWSASFKMYKNLWHVVSTTTVSVFRNNSGRFNTTYYEATYLLITKMSIDKLSREILNILEFRVLDLRLI